MELYMVGLDYHLHTSTIVMLDPHGKPIATHTIRGHWSKMVQWLKEQDKPMAICYEASSGYGPLHDQLTRFAQQVVVAHPGRLRLIYQSKRKNDQVDALKLAQLLFMDMLPKVHVPSAEVRAWREMINFRKAQVEGRTRVKNLMRGLLRNQGVEVPAQFKENLWSVKGRQWLKDLKWPDLTATFRCEELLGQLAHLDAAVKKATDHLNTIAATKPGVKVLMTIPGVGPRTAEAMVAFVDDATRFTRINKIGSYLGLVPTQDSSAGVNRLGHITKNGPAVARQLLTEASWQCVRKCPQMRAFFDRITTGKKERRRIAVIAVAHKLARIMLAMLRSGETWNPDRHVTDQEDKDAGLRPAA